MGKNKEWQPFSLRCKFTSFSHKLQLHLPHSKDTLGVMSLQHVLVTYHSICTGQEISCWNKLRDSRSSKLLCVNWRIFVKIYVSATEFYCNKSHKFSLIWFCEICCGDKILLKRQRFLQKLSVQTKKFVSVMCRSNVLLQIVCFNIKSTHLRFWQIQSHRVL